MRDVQGGSVGNKPQARYEIWMKGDKALVAHPAGGSEEIRILIDGNTTYGWRVGEPKGLKYESPSTDERTMFLPSIDYMLKAEPCRAHGKEGEHRHHRRASLRALRVRRIGRHALHLLLRHRSPWLPAEGDDLLPDHTIVIYEARNIEVPASIPDSMLQLPARVQFEIGPS